MERYHLEWPQRYLKYGSWLARNWQNRDFYEREKIIVRETGERVSAAFRSDEFYLLSTLYSVYFRNSEDKKSLRYLEALLNSGLTQFYMYNLVFSLSSGAFIKARTNHYERLPIREIEFTTPEAEREAHVNSLIDAVETARPTTAPADKGDGTSAVPTVLNAVDDHLETDRTGVIHDLLAHLAREMTQFKEERHRYNLDVTDYVPAPSGSDAGVPLREIGRYQPAPGVQDTLLADTTDERDGLRVGRLVADREDDTVHVRATARFKPQGDREDWPAAVPGDAEPDQWGYMETEPIDVCTLHDCTEIEAGLVVHWLQTLNDTDAGFSGYRDNATKTNSLLDRIYDVRLPDPSDDGVANALRPFLDNAAAAAELDAQVVFTDGLIDQIVYRLYGLSEEEVAVVEEE